MRLYAILPLCSTLAACGDPVSRDIDDLIEGGENAERAKMSLSLAKKSAIAPLIAALQERQHTSFARPRRHGGNAQKPLPARARRTHPPGARRSHRRRRPGGTPQNCLAFGDLRQRKSVAPMLDQLAVETDDASWRDDCMEVFLDVNHDHVSFCQIVVNSLGTIFDMYNDGSTNGGDIGWNGEYEVATHVGENFCSAEIGIAATQFDKEINPGDVWGFNVARICIANAAEYGQWVPTYGRALRPERFGFLILN